MLGIDEGQFFPDIVPFCEEMANAGKLVIVAALDGTFQRKVRRHSLAKGKAQGRATTAVRAAP